MDPVEAEGAWNPMMNGLSSEILFEKFQIIEVLKKDDHAAVFLADHIYLSKKIILKVLNTQKISDSTLVERFKREAKILAKLDSANIIKVLDFGMYKEYFYISFEYIEGSSLRNLLKQSELSQEQKVHLMIQLLKGLYFAHQNQIIHRDIKPENIFVDSNLNLKVGDFGLALSAEDNFVTNPYSIVGTPSYMSPEQVRGAKLTAQSDLFSAGVVLYELFVGKNPFLRENVNLTLNEIMAFDEGEVITGLVEQPQEIKDVLTRLLKKNSKERYLTALEALTNLGVSVDQPTVVLTYEERNNPRKLWPLIIAVLATVFVFGLGWMLIKAFDETKQQIGRDQNNLTKETQQNQKVDTIQKDILKFSEKVIPNNLNKPLIENPSQQLPVEDKQTQSAATQQQNPPSSIPNKPVEYGWFDVQSNEGTKIIINGEEVGIAPIQKPLMYREGGYNLKLINPNYPPYDTTFSIKGKETTKLYVNLNSLVAYIDIYANPWGKVYFNSAYKGDTPLSKVKVVPDAIRISLRQNGYQDIDTVINVKKGDNLNLKFRFRKN
jgi:eukaryotic-like serine/threonine-protein kinase